eukprot:TRINITY_DN10683_c0_g1_i1.p1 TRINITY_DN10683_c0_g1~~TRINITY_DN10683_c0_g1_i1.p1  ORF type:complete len:143 (+),score=19.04 TRINITY_DN10683_c0_g1_i1:95-523(+)
MFSTVFIFLVFMYNIVNFISSSLTFFFIISPDHINIVFNIFFHFFFIYWHTSSFIKIIRILSLIMLNQNIVYGPFYLITWRLHPAKPGNLSVSHHDPVRLDHNHHCHHDGQSWQHIFEHLGNPSNLVCLPMYSALIPLLTLR